MQLPISVADAAQPPTPNGRAPDVIAGLSIAGLLLPEGLAYSRLAGLTPAHGLIAAVAGILVYGIMGRSRFAVISATSASALATAAALGTLGRSGDPSAALLLGAMVGALFLLFGCFGLGFIAAFVSRAVLRGFAFGLAVSIILRQIPSLIGWDRGASAGFHPNPLAAVVGIGALLLILSLRPVPRVPGAAAALIAGIGASLLLGLGNHGVKLVGDFAFSIAPPVFAAAGADQLFPLLMAALPIALIVFAESWGSIRTLALRDGDGISPNRELIALGLSNLASAGAGGQPVGAGFSASSANQTVGAQSRVAAYVAAAGLVVLLLVGKPLIARIPEPVLAAVVIAALSHALDPRPLLRLYTLRRDFWIAMIATVGVLAFGVLSGLLIAVGLSVVALLARFATPNFTELGQVGDSSDFVEIARHPDARRLDGVVIMRAGEPLFFANVERILMQIEACAAERRARAVIFSLEDSNDLDSTCVDVLAEAAERLSRSGCELRLARVKDPVRDVLDRGGPIAQKLAAQSTRSVFGAAQAVLEEPVA